MLVIAGGSDFAVKILRVRARIENFELCRSFIEEQLEAASFDRKTIIKVVTACEEIIVNVMNYAYTHGEGDLEISFVDGVDHIKLTFIDSGAPFNPFDQPEVDISLSLDERDIGGLGILMVKKMMDEVHYEYVDGRNILSIVKKVTKGEV